MRWDLKRSLILWPAAASASIIAASWLAQQNWPPVRTVSDWLRQQPFVVLPSTQLRSYARLHLPVGTTLLGVDTDVDVHLSSEVPAMATEVPTPQQGGRRAMQLPQRVAQVYGVSDRRVHAPVRNVQTELAGLVTLEQIAQEEEEARLLHEKHDLHVQGRGAECEENAANCTTAANVTGHHSDQRLADPSFADSDWSEWTSPRAAVSRSQPGFPDSVLSFRTSSEERGQTHASVLPDSTRALGRLILNAPAERARDVRDLPSPPRPQVEPPKALQDSLSSPSDQPALPELTPPSREADMPSVSGELNTQDEAIAEPHDRGASDADQANNSGARPVVRPPGFGRSLIAWPLTATLDDQLTGLKTLYDETETAAWAQRVEAALAELQAMPRIGDPAAKNVLLQLQELARDGLRQAESVQQRQRQIDWLVTGHALTRRLSVWKPVYAVTTPVKDWMVGDLDAAPLSQESLEISDNSDDASFISVRDAVANVQRELNATGDAEGWADFLLLEEVTEAVQAPPSRQRVILAQRLLSRLQWHAMDDRQKQMVKTEAVQQLATSIEPWAQGAVDYARLLRQIERQESDAIDLTSIDIAGAVQTLRFTKDKSASGVGKAIDTYYRNANVRLAISDAMIERMIPDIDPQTIPLRTRVLGSQVRGRSHIESDLKLTLKPSPDRWLLNLGANGRVSSHTIGTNGPVSVHSSANAAFNAASPISVARDGVDIGDPHIEVAGRSHLRGIRTDYDGWPLIGSLVRSIAESRYKSLQPRTEQIARQKIRHQVRDEFDQRLRERVDQASERLNRVAFGPLADLQLEPRVTDMCTTDRRLIARYRLAGDWQIGAFTPRPRAPQSSVMSLQVHQSALNNTLEQLIPREEPIAIDQLVRHGLETFGQQDVTLPPDLPDDVTVQFAPTRPITVEIEEGSLWITLRVLYLRRGDRMDLTHFIVRAQYVPRLSGLKPELVREGHLRISGPGMSMRERLPIRAIFNKVLSSSRPLPILAPALTEHPSLQGLAVSQLELRDGWLALAISDEEAPRIALKPLAESSSRH